MSEIEFSEIKWKVSSFRERKGGEIYVFCQCQCGVEKWVRKSSLFVDSFSCKRCSNAMRKHGDSGKRLYNIWSAMKQRCFYKDSISYHRYGARGISVCDEWKNDFQSFKEWALSSGYDDSLSIDRIDVNGHYCPENCRWATDAEQSRNTSRNVFFEHGGRRMVLKDWCRELGLNYDAVRDRISRGWTIEEAILGRSEGAFH